MILGLIAGWALGLLFLLACIKASKLQPDYLRLATWPIQVIIWMVTLGRGRWERW